MRRAELRRELATARLERAIGVVYRPETELASHYFHAVLPRQFDEFVWFDHSEAVQPIEIKVAQLWPEMLGFQIVSVIRQKRVG